MDQRVRAAEREQKASEQELCLRGAAVAPGEPTEDEQGEERRTRRAEHAEEEERAHDDALPRRRSPRVVRTDDRLWARRSPTANAITPSSSWPSSETTLQRTV